MSQATLTNSTAPALWLDACWPRQGILKDALAVVGGSLLVALLAQVAVPLPFSPVPVTGQTLGVLLLAAALGARRSALALVLYLVEGAAGLSVFAPGVMFGAARLLGPTGGYLMAFPVAAYLLGWLAERGWSRRIWRLGMAMVLAEGVIFACGVAWLALLLRVPLARALHLGLYPFLPGEVVKSVLATLLLPAAWSLLAARVPLSRDPRP